MGLKRVLKQSGIFFGGFLALVTLSIMNSSYTNARGWYAVAGLGLTASAIMYLVSYAEP